MAICFGALPCARHTKNPGEGNPREAGCRKGGDLRYGALHLGARRREVITAEALAERAGNVCFLAADAEALARRLAERKVLVWSGGGRVRVSAHLHNDAADIRRFFEALDAVGEAGGPEAQAGGRTTRKP